MPIHLLAGATALGAGLNLFGMNQASSAASRAADRSNRLSEEYLRQSTEDRARQWERYNQFVKPMEQDLLGYAQRNARGDISGAYARALSAVDPQFKRSEEAIRSNMARSGISSDNPESLAYMLSRNDMARINARVGIRKSAEVGGQNAMAQLLGGRGQPQAVSPAYGINADRSAGRFDMQGAGYNAMGTQAIGQGASDLASMYWLKKYLPQGDTTPSPTSTPNNASWLRNVNPNNLSLGYGQ